MSWVIPKQQKPIQASLSPPSSFEDPRTPLQLAGDCMVAGHTAAMTQTSAGRRFSMPCSFLYLLASSLDQVSCTPIPRPLRVAEGSGTSAQFPGSFFTGSDQGGKGREGDMA